MSEETGQKREDGIDFDSANIGKKKKAVQFTVIEGAEERAKAAERAKQAAEKEAEELHQAEIEAASARQAKAEDQERLKKGGLLYRLFGGYRKWITLLILLLIAAGIAGFFWWKNREVVLTPQQTAKAFYEEQLAKIDEDNFEETYPPVRDAMDKAWGDAKGDDKFWYAYYYALLLREEGFADDSAVYVLQQTDVPSELTQEEKCLIWDLWLNFTAYDLDFGLTEEDYGGCQ